MIPYVQHYCTFFNVIHTIQICWGKRRVGWGGGGGMIGGRRREQKGKIEEGEDDTEEKDEAGETGNRILSIQEKKTIYLIFTQSLPQNHPSTFIFLSTNFN